ncbi:hypothetical protein HDC92_004579 [Pedobacter sp. AK017]|uniref:hypothetical protein n=1 Tax=Pedobacter sp. AK017 TaxID=2723073 RepID=UPI00161DDD6A|nr:hypothetical protein [Pedobacter sp. AK017]MBB5440875.1 hypothetical protein [Pedobacter sp. AK017]
MKYFLFIYGLISLSGCAYQPLLKSNIKTVHILFKDNQENYSYKLYDDSVVKWDKKNIGIKRALSNNRNRLPLLKKEGPDYLAHFFINKKNHKYMPIKVLPLKEFGYIEMNSSKVIFYGIMRDALIDLTNDRVYY